jgi:AAA+ ATPase superfamily predicted ATPase
MEQKQDILIGRDAEKKHLESIVQSKEAEFVVVYGRRRVGKTFLVNTFFSDNYAFKLTGLAKKSKREQLANFAVSLNRYGGGTKYKKPRTWYEAFNMLRTLLEQVHVKGKRVVFIDELPWMDSRGSNLVSALEHFWNDWAVTQNEIILIVCGSATSWITKKILKNRGGLHNRVTQRIYIRPFTLAECKEYLKSRDIIMADKDIAECYMIMGGIPFYLKNVRRGASLSQNVDEMFFADKGRLDDEFNASYTSLFK